MALILLGLSLFLFTHHRQVEENQSLRWYDRSLNFLVTPIVRVVVYSRERIRLLVGRYIYLVRVEKENESLRNEIENDKLNGMRFREVTEENERFRRLLALKEKSEGEGVAARVLSYPPLGPYRLLTIDKGAREGLERRLPVIAADGLVGQVWRVMKNESQILLITDPTSAVDARIDTTEARGLVVGKVLNLGLERDLFIGAFEYLNQTTEIEEGAAVVTSGLDGVYPSGILIGNVKGLPKGKDDIFQRAEVIPAVDFYKLKEVLVFKKGGR